MNKNIQGRLEEPHLSQLFIITVIRNIIHNFPAGIEFSSIFTSIHKKYVKKFEPGSYGCKMVSKIYKTKDMCLCFDIF